VVEIAEAESAQQALHGRAHQYSWQPPFPLSATENLLQCGHLQACSCQFEVPFQTGGLDTCSRRRPQKSRKTCAMAGKRDFLLRSARGLE
jgi:hypothetical protein